MTPRDPHEPHRSSTPLELLFDLCFVVAIAQAGARLHHGIVEGHASHASLGYAVVFFAIWWAWMNFTWFASAYDTDDVPYRLLVLVQIAGVLVLAAGVWTLTRGLGLRAGHAGHGMPAPVGVSAPMEHAGHGKPAATPSTSEPTTSAPSADPHARHR
jgi:hypothetical protein